MQAAMGQTLGCFLPDCRVVVRVTSGSVNLNFDILLTAAGAGAQAAAAQTVHASVTNVVSQGAAAVAQMTAMDASSLLSVPTVAAPVAQTVAIAVAPPPPPLPPPPSPPPPTHVKCGCNRFVNGASPSKLSFCVKSDECYPAHNSVCPSDMAYCADDTASCTDSTCAAGCVRHLRHLSDRRGEHCRRVLADSTAACRGAEHRRRVLTGSTARRAEARRFGSVRCCLCKLRGCEHSRSSS